MAEDDLLPESLEKLEIASPSLLEPDTQPTLESLTLLGDECPRESCNCNKKGHKCAVSSSGAWNSRRFVHKPFTPRVRSSQNFGILRKSRFKPSNTHPKTWILREPILKLESICHKEESSSTVSSTASVQLDPKPTREASSEIAKLSLGHIRSQGRVFGASASVSCNDFSVLRASKTVPEEVKGQKQFTAKSYLHIRLSTSCPTAMHSSKVTKRKKEHRKEGAIKPRPISDSTNIRTVRSSSNHPSGSQSTTCSQQARMVGSSHVNRGNDDVTIDELASYFDLFVHIPRKMSHMAENMYI